MKTAMYGFLCHTTGVFLADKSPWWGVVLAVLVVVIGVGFVIEALTINAWHWGDRHDRYDQ